MLTELTNQFINNYGLTLGAKCSFCEKPISPIPSEQYGDDDFPGEAFCSSECVINWDSVQVKYEEIDWDNELKRQEGF
jgi:hypothetical protein